MPWTKDSLVIAPMKAENREEAIRQLAGVLFAEGYVRDTFVEAVLKREAAYPTGLPTPTYQVAIPHTDPEHVIRPAIALGILDTPVEFQEMGNPDSTLKISLICMLAIKQSELLVKLLESLMELFQDTEFLRCVCGSHQPEEIASLFNSRIPDPQETL